MFRYIWEIIEHIAAVALVVGASKLFEFLFGRDLSSIVHKNSILDNIIIVFFCVFGYLSFFLLIRYIQFLNSPTNLYRGFYLQKFKLNDKLYISIYRCYANFWAGSKSIRIIGRCYLNNDNRFLLYGFWESHHEVRFSENSIVYLYRGTHGQDHSYGCSKLSTVNSNEFSGYFYDLEGGFVSNDATKRISFISTKLNQGSFIKKVIPDSLNRFLIPSYNLILRDGRFLDIFMRNHSSQELTKSTFVTEAGKQALLT